MRRKTGETLRKCALIPVLRSRSAELAEQALQCLCEAGAEAVEVTMTVPNACDLIAKANQMGLCAGAGTVFSLDCAVRCIQAGAKFIVSPIMVDGLAELCHEADVFCMLGAVTPNEVYRAAACGADAVKIFPAGSVGGPGYLSSLRDVFPDVPFCPTGGVRVDNIGGYLKAGAAMLGAGGSMFDFAAIAAGDYEKAKARMRTFIEEAQSARQGLAEQ